LLRAQLITTFEVGPARCAHPARSKANRNTRVRQAGWNPPHRHAHAQKRQGRGARDLQEGPPLAEGKLNPFNDLPAAETFRFAGFFFP